MAKELKDLTKRAENYSQWYNDLVVKADLAEQSPVRGCMVIKPYGFAIWEKMRDQLDKMFKATGVQNAYFPLLIPKSFLSREAEHVKGFAKECAVVTHYRLKSSEEGNSVVVDPSAKLEEELIIRPTSETIIWNTYKGWIHSWRDLPIMCNQWCNVMRWEMRTRPFLRTSEFLWQEGHTAHATREEAEVEAQKMLKVYADFAEKWMAVPVLQGVKSETERFAGALDTYTIEAMMQDGKALQAGTSHYFGTNFSEPFDIKYLSKDGKLEYCHETSWGVSTRLIGAVIMTHGDERGLRLPPKIAPYQAVILPIAAHKGGVLEKCEELAKLLKESGLRIKLDDRDYVSPGWKFNEWELKGVPLRLEIGPRDIENGIISLARRDTNEKFSIPFEGAPGKIQEILDDIQASMLKIADEFRLKNTKDVFNMDELKAQVNGGYARAMWCGDRACEDRIKEETGATSRNTPFDGENIGDKCVCCGKKADKLMYFAKAY